MRASIGNTWPASEHAPLFKIKIIPNTDYVLPYYTFFHLICCLKCFQPQGNQFCRRMSKVLLVKQVSGGGCTASSPSSAADTEPSPTLLTSVSISGCCSERGSSAGLLCSGQYFWEPFPLWLLSGCHFSSRSQGGLGSLCQERVSSRL